MILRYVETIGNGDRISKIYYDAKGGQYITRLYIDDKLQPSYSILSDSYGDAKDAAQLLLEV